MKRSVSWNWIAVVLFAAPLPLNAAAPVGLYTLAADTVRDNRTGLVWQRTATVQLVGAAAAASYCQNLSLGGVSSGWRLPRLKELQTLVDVRSQPLIDAAAFPGAQGGYWSSSPGPSAGYAWSVNFDFATMVYFWPIATSLRVRCVR